MFTGITQELGTINKLSTQKGIQTITIRAPKLSKSQKIGASITVDGACLTTITKTSTTFTVEAIPETLTKTIARSYKIGNIVNLEPALKMGAALDGHLVSGHIDFTATIKALQQVGDSKVLTITFPKGMGKYIAMKGSITVNGVSLTISKLHSDAFEVSLIPLTQKTTNLGKLKKNASVNVEIDLIARYLENLLKQKDQQITYQFLQERGFV